MQLYVIVILILVALILLLLFIGFRSFHATKRSAVREGDVAQEQSEGAGPGVVDRRDFVKAFVVGGTAAATSMIIASKWPRKRWDEVADVAIVGFGAAGAAAALEASVHGADVIVLEKMSIGGGTTTMSAGTIYASETSIQRESGIRDSAEEMFKLLMAAGKGLNRPELVEVAAHQSGAIIEWLLELGVGLWPGAYIGDSFGCELYPEYARITPPVPRVHVVEGMGEELFTTLAMAVAQRPIHVLLETPGNELITEGGEVIGIRARNKGGTLNIRTRKGVILTTGGFMYNKEMLARFCPRGYKSLPLGNPGDEGDGIQMGRKVGGNIWGMSDSDTNGLPAVRIPGQELGRPLLVNYYSFPSILVDRNGDRFVNEGIFYEFVNDALLALEGDPPGYVIFDDVVLRQAEDKIVKYCSAGLLKEIKEGLVIQASTIESLAARIGMKAGRLSKTLDRYNDLASAGKDLDFGKTYEMGLEPVREPPFLAIPVHPGMIATTGGLKINTNAQVLDMSDHAIPGLYAAGRTTGGVLGAVFPASGVNLLDALCFGRIAGRNAASCPR
jgi:fumarate reductase flavoprotein subunit